MNKLTWEITTENLYTEDCFDELYEAWISREKVKVYFGMKAETTDPEKTVADGDYPNWTGAKGKCGLAVITSLTANANTGENATFSATFTGYGKLETLASFPATASVQTMSTTSTKASVAKV